MRSYNGGGGTATELLNLVGPKVHMIESGGNIGTIKVQERLLIGTSHSLHCIKDDVIKCEIDMTEVQHKLLSIKRCSKKFAGLAT